VHRLQIQALSTFDLPHLVRRFFQVVGAKPLTPAEQALVERTLRPVERPLFWAQSVADQRHAVETMRRAGLFTPDAAVLNAALLHDVGKAASALGALGRTVATVLDVLGLPMTSRMRAYREHGPIGAARLAAAGASALAVDFARRHPDPDPGGNDRAAWHALIEADDA
jgi:hypothetical protein